MQLIRAVREHFFEAIIRVASDASTDLLQRISVTRDPQFGDYQANLALVMTLGKTLGREPLAIAKEIVDALEVNPWFAKVEIAGKGFINLTLRNDFLLTKLNAIASDGERLDVQGTVECKRFIVDYSSPNVAKPMHVGHIRSTVIGDAIVRTLRFLRHSVISDNHLGDWGTQFGMVIYGYKHFVNKLEFEQHPVTELGRLYRKVQQIIGYQKAIASLPKLQAEHERELEKIRELEVTVAANPSDKKIAKSVESARKKNKERLDSISEVTAKIQSVRENEATIDIIDLHSDLESRVLRETAKLHEGDAENLLLWKTFLPYCKAEIHSVYERLNIEFDFELGESFYHAMLEPLVEKLTREGLASESQGAICVFLDNFEAPMIIRKQDGAFLYATTDLATVDYRMKEFSPDVILYVVDHRQADHFKKLFACLKKTGLANVELRHISFGTVLGKDKKPFKTRSGTVVGLEPLIDEAVDRALDVVCNPERLQKSSLQLDDKEKREIAEAVGVGAIKYADLSHHRESDYEFDLEKMVMMEGNTAAYIQYSYARTQSILRRIQEAGEATADLSADTPFSHPIERSLVLQLLRFEDTLLSSMEDFLPNAITDYLYEVAKLFASFFDQCPVLRAEDQKTKALRIMLVRCTGLTLGKGLELLGITAVEKM